MSLDLDSVLKSLLTNFENSIYFIIISSVNGVVLESYINEDEFNKSSISLNISQVYELAEEITQSIGIQTPDFNLIHSDNFYILSVKILDKIIIILTEDQIEIGQIFQIINNCILTA